MNFLSSGVSLHAVTSLRDARLTNHQNDFLGIWNHFPNEKDILDHFTSAIPFGRAFLIIVGDQVVGTTSWSIWPLTPTIVRLHAHGILPHARKRHYSRDALREFLALIAAQAPSNCTKLVVNVPITSTDTWDGIGHLQHYGFHEGQDPYQNEVPLPVMSLFHEIPGR